ncbi:transglycosylase SLT domain-containing protein [bacterium]|nr:transglycosylase SLT domain-containing protein [bacterium]
MFKNINIKKYLIIGGITVLLCLLFCGVFLFFCFIGNPFKADEIYLNALTELKEGNYSSAYYKFSKVSYLSDLKPYAIFHKIECANALDDKKTVIKQNHLLFNIYPNNELAPRAKYFYAAEIMDKEPSSARRYFDEIIKKYPDTDYATGAKYRIAVLLNQKYSQSDISTSLDKSELENYLREYLREASTGKWTLSAIDLWLKNISDLSQMSDEDKILISDILCMYNQADRAEKLLLTGNFERLWAKRAKVQLQKGEKTQAFNTISDGLKSNNSVVPEGEKNDVILRYILSQKNKERAISELAKAAQGKNDLFIKTQKCRYTDNYNLKALCFSNILKFYDYKTFSEPVLYEQVIENSLLHNYELVKELGEEFLNKYPLSQNADAVLYWLGKSALISGKKQEAKDYFEKIILKYPDSYYALRSYITSNNINNSLITRKIEPENILFPYYNKANSTLIKLAEFKDLSALAYVYERDPFVQSWIAYEKNEPSKAMVVARDAMAAMEQKPDKSDLRWRLIYPTFMYEDIKTYADKAGNNPVLMTALVREESYFNENAHSYVGAKGLMQLMPATAKEINRIKSVGISDFNEMFTKENNLLLGNLYYNFILTNLNDNNILAVAAYNGGIGSISKWKKGMAYSDIDEFVEKIPYSETRNYVKKVFRTYWNYARIYL